MHECLCYCYIPLMYQFTSFPLALETVSIFPANMIFTYYMECVSFIIHKSMVALHMDIVSGFPYLWIITMLYSFHNILIWFFLVNLWKMWLYPLSISRQSNTWDNLLILVPLSLGCFFHNKIWSPYELGNNRRILSLKDFQTTHFLIISSIGGLGEAS